MSNTKERQTQQLLDGDLHKYLMHKETWTDHIFDSVDWVGYGTVCPTVKTNSGVQGLSQPGTQGDKHMKYHGGVKPCCMYSAAHEDWRHLLFCPSLDASLHCAES
jgi:hypothetical protein